MNLKNTMRMNLKKTFMASALLLAACCMQAQTQVIAHRGFWKTPGSSQNSITALLKADSIGCYGSEFDVWIAKDNKLVVNHDPVYKMRPMEHTKGAALTGLKLSNGENLPSLEQYLDAGKKCNTRLILELKAHSNKKRETKAVQEIISMVKKMGLEDRMEYITFSLHAMKEFIRLAPTGTPIFYLNGEISPKELKELGAAGLDYHLGVMKKHPEWFKEAHDLGLKVNVWTVDKEEDMKWLIDQKVDFITTNEPVILQEVLKNNR